MIVWEVNCPKCKKPTKYITLSCSWGHQMTIQCTECGTELDVRPNKEYWDKLWQEIQKDKAGNA